MVPKFAEGQKAGDLRAAGWGCENERSGYQYSCGQQVAMREIKKLILDSIETKLKIVKDPEILARIEWAGQLLISTLRNGNKILIAGNGGSAADAQHFAAELAGKFILNRRGLPAIALTGNSSIVTAIANDFGYEYVFSRQIEALAIRDDVFVGISTSGNSSNILLASQVARQLGLQTISILGNNGGNVAQYFDISIIVPSANTQAIQEAHILVIHILCLMIDDAFGRVDTF